MPLYTNKRSHNKGLYRTKRTNKGLKLTNKSTNDNVKYGGINPNLTDANFRYTIQRWRRTWVKNIYPGLEALTRCIAEIDWNVNYTATGLVTIKGDIATGNPKYDLNTTENTLEPADVVDIYRPVSNDVNISIQVTDILKPIFAGGICYEILNDYYQPLGVPDLHTVVDPTGDIDIKMLRPSYIIEPSESEKIFNAANAVNDALVEKARVYNLENAVKIGEEKKDPNTGKIEITDRIDRQMDSFIRLTQNADIHPIYGELLSAVFSKCAGAIGTLDLTALLPNATDFDISEYKISLDENAVNVTDMFGFREQIIGKLHLVAFMYLTQAKIDALGDNEYNTDIRVQLVAKFNNDPDAVVDHCLEIIIPITQNKSFDITGEGLIAPFETIFCKDGVLSNGFNRLTLTGSPEKTTAVQLNGSDKTVVMTPLETLLEDNINAYSERVKRLDHKAYNHVGRMIYLFILMMHKPTVGANIIKFRLLDQFFRNIMQKIPSILTDGFQFAKIDDAGDLQKYSIAVQDILLAFAPVLLRVPHRQLINWFDLIKQFSSRKSDKELQANDAIKNYDLSSDVSKEATSAAYDSIINGTSIGWGWSRNRTRGRRSYRRGRGGNRSKKQR